MATLKHFEDIDAWKKARELTKEIYKVSSTNDFARDFPLQNQICRAAVSIMSNIAEGFERDGTTEFRQFLSYAKGSAGEVRSQLYVAFDAGFINNAEFDTLSELAVDVIRLISGFMRYLGNSNHKGQKHK